MKKPLHRNVLSCAASPLKLSELKSSKQICYQVAASHLNPCALLLANLITINKLRLKLKSLTMKASALLLSSCIRPHLRSDKSSSPGEQLKEIWCALLLKMRPPPCKCS
jgi:hypothetical protein